MADKIRIPVEIDYSKGLAEISKFANSAKSVFSGIGTGGGANGNINIGIGFTANTDQLKAAVVSAIKPIEQLEKEIRELEQAIRRSTEPAELKRFNDQITRLQSQISNLKVVGFETSLNKVGSSAGSAAGKLQQLPNVANRATGTITDLSRVLQDAPYGFIGIANNLNPMLEGFQRLQKESGGSKAALRALAQSMTGAGGLGFGLSLITAAISFSTIGFGAWTRGMGGASKAAKQTKTDNEELASSIKQITSELASEITKVTTLFTALNRGGLSSGQRKQALEDLKRINQEYFGSLKDEEGLINNLKTAYQGYLSQIIEVGRTKAIESQLTKLFDKKLQIELALDPKFLSATNSTTQKQIALYKRQLEELGGVVDVNAVPFNPQFGELTDEQRSQNENLRKRIALTQQIIALEAGTRILFSGDNVAPMNKELEQINLQIRGLTALLGNAKGIEIDPIKETGSDDVIARAKEIANYLKNETTFLVTYEFSPLDTKEQARAKAQAFLDEVAAGKLRLRPLQLLGDIIEPPSPRQVREELDQIQRGLQGGIIIPVKLETPENFSDNFLQNAQQLLELRKIFEEQGFTLPSDLVDMEAPAGANYDEIMAYLDALQKAREQAQLIGSMIETAVIPAFENMFQTILEGGNAMEGFLNGLKQGINQLIQALISAALRAAILSALTGGKTSFKTAFLGSFGVTGFASGGLVSGPVLSLTGEGRGTSAYNPEVIAPLDQLQSFFRGQVADLVSGRSGGASIDTVQRTSLDVPREVRISMDGDELVGFLRFTEKSIDRRG